MNPASDIPVYYNAGRNCYEAVVQNQRCVAECEISDGRMIFTHTYVPPGLRGQGIAEQIVRFALDDARAKGLRVTPACSYVARFIDRHPEYREAT